MKKETSKWRFYHCKECSESAHPRHGGTKKFCSSHRRVQTKDIPFDSLTKDETRKSRLIKERGHECEECGIAEWRGKPAPIQLDHIDGHPGHNAKENLRLLCANCHAQTEFYCGRNAGKHSGTERQKKMARYPNYRAIMKNSQMPE